MYTYIYFSIHIFYLYIVYIYYFVHCNYHVILRTLLLPYIYTRTLLVRSRVMFGVCKSYPSMWWMYFYLFHVFILCYFDVPCVYVSFLCAYFMMWKVWLLRSIYTCLYLFSLSLFLCVTTSIYDVKHILVSAKKLHYWWSYSYSSDIYYLLKKGPSWEKRSLNLLYGTSRYL